jgi:N-acetyl-alpha-D-muramate 1-phosphate uridylyltransferase
MQCVILAGGLGTRMRPLTDEVPKALLPVAGAPFVEHQLALVAHQGFDRVVFCIGHHGAMLRDVVGDGARFRLDVLYADEGEHLRGTAGALRVAFDAALLDEQFAVLYGDSYLPIDVRPVWTAFEECGAPALMTVLRNDDRWDTSNAAYAEGRVTRYDKHDPDPTMRYVDYGLSLLGRDVVPARVPPGAVGDLADVFHALSLEGNLAGYEVSQRFYEAGSPTGLADLEAFLAGRSGG